MTLSATGNKKLIKLNRHAPTVKQAFWPLRYAVDAGTNKIYLGGMVGDLERSLTFK